MEESPNRHPRRAEAEALIREGRLRGYEIAERCGISTQTVKMWARALGVRRVKGTTPYRREDSGWQEQGRVLLRQGVGASEIARRLRVSRSSVYNLRWAMEAEAQP